VSGGDRPLPPSPLSQWWERGSVVGEGGSANAFQDGWGIDEDFIIAKTEHPIAIGGEMLGSGLVILDLVFMDGAIKLDGQFVFGAVAVEHKRTDRVLTTNLQSCQCSPA